MKRVIIVGSPRSNGRCAHLAEMLFEANIDEQPEDELFLVPVSEVEIGPCIGCGACRELMDVTFKGEDGSEITEPRPRCVFDDDMQTLYDLIDEADEVTVVSPVYFSGAPAMMKCVLDRLQPYFMHRDFRTERLPLTLHVVGEGGDPHGFDPLVSEVKSAFASAGFRLERVLDWVGKIDRDGEIVSEATEIVVSAPGAQSSAKPADGGVGAKQGPQAAKKDRPKLDLSAQGKQRSGKSSAKGGPKSGAKPQQGGNSRSGQRKGGKPQGGRSQGKGSRRG